MPTISRLLRGSPIPLGKWLSTNPPALFSFLFLPNLGILAIAAAQDGKVHSTTRLNRQSWISKVWCLLCSWSTHGAPTPGCARYPDTFYMVWVHFVFFLLKVGGSCVCGRVHVCMCVPTRTCHGACVECGVSSPPLHVGSKGLNSGNQACMASIITLWDTLPISWFYF